MIDEYVDYYKQKNNLTDESIEQMRNIVREELQLYEQLPPTMTHSELMKNHFTVGAKITKIFEDNKR